MSIYATMSGRLGKNAETRQAGSSNVTGFSVATDTGFGDRKQTLWVDCSMWGKRGEAVAPYLVKGAYVTVSGELTTREHDGKTYLQIEVAGLDLGPKTEQRQDTGRSQGRGQGGYGGKQQTGGYGGKGGDDDIPF